jgi:hypothetical protein
MTKHNNEFARFDRTMEQLLTVPHSEIKAKLDAEKRAKQRKRKAKLSKKRAGHAEK